MCFMENYQQPRRKSPVIEGAKLIIYCILAARWKQENYLKKQ
jgi:hypothetical protein